MMRACRSVGSVLSLVLPVGIAAVTGCQTPPPPVVAAAPAPAPTVTGSSASDRSTLEVFGGTKTAIVSGVRSDPNPSLSQAGLRVTDLSGVSVRDIVTYVDHQQNVIANGEILSIAEAPAGGPPPMLVTATFEPISAGRAPREGDWALIRSRSR